MPTVFDTLTDKADARYKMAVQNQKPTSLLGAQKGQTESALMEGKLGTQRMVECSGLRRQAPLLSVRELEPRNSSQGERGVLGNRKNTHERQAKKHRKTSSLR